MKKKVNKLLKIILMIILIINTLAIYKTRAYANNKYHQEAYDGGSGAGASGESNASLSSNGMTDIGTNPGLWKPSTPANSTALNDKVGTIVSLVRIVGIIVSVVSLSLIGIKFMLASVEEKARYKQTMMPWIIGAIMIFAITTIPTLIFDMVQGSL